jgi:hypothetical protein
MQGGHSCAANVGRPGSGHHGWLGGVHARKVHPVYDEVPLPSSDTADAVEVSFFRSCGVVESDGTVLLECNGI